MFVCISLTIILGILFLCIIILDKTCHTVSMMITANTCLSAIVAGCSLLSMCIFTLENDIKQISYEDSLCILRGYFCYASCAVFDYSFLLQSIYRYITVVYPLRLFWQSAKFQALLICSTWIFSYVFPAAFMFTNEFIYNVDNQICQLPLRLSFSIIYATHCIYVIPVSLIMFIYLKLVRYVKEMSKRVTPANILARAKRELRMVQRTVILVTILLTLGVPYTIIIFMSFFTNPPKYHFRIAFIFVDVSLAFVMIALLKFTDPLRMSLMKRVNGRRNTVVATIT
ncbi:unnamed protein product [Rotaria sp. Silwood1]|nr:unnamed protein product [Rotaria sp. Silwood1]CAF1358868.1 unnamed protein product [Rotaria sp. Silwood1]CAF1413518.1 unnamed protein product [Rotaria sp. Silwood1]CAF3495218.1 unnamed protein product [Rotaria sp. Silwood1]CAF3530549.1 unnamed protein product [Rotaria sp. Silwood1]